MERDSIEKENKIVKSFYIPEPLFEWSHTEAKRIGIAQNALLLQLIDDGIKFRKLIEQATIYINPQK